MIEGLTIATTICLHLAMATTLFTFQKSAAEAEDDRRNRVVRVGGLWRQPNYLRSYAKASAMLLRAAGDDDCYDDVGLPLFYLQRHTVELAMKEVMHVVLDLSDMAEILAVPQDENWCEVADACARRPRTVAEGHVLADLWNNANELLARRVPAMTLPDEFERLVGLIADVENDTRGRARPDRLRYPHMRLGKGRTRDEARSVPSLVTCDGVTKKAPPLTLPLGALDDGIRALLGGPMRCESYTDGTFLAALAIEHGALAQRLAAAGRL